MQLLSDTAKYLWVKQTSIMSISHICVYMLFWSLFKYFTLHAVSIRFWTQSYASFLCNLLGQFDTEISYSSIPLCMTTY